MAYPQTRLDSLPANQAGLHTLRQGTIYFQNFALFEKYNVIAYFNVSKLVYKARFPPKNYTGATSITFGRGNDVCRLRISLN